MFNFLSMFKSNAPQPNLHLNQLQRQAQAQNQTIISQYYAQQAQYMQNYQGLYTFSNKTYTGLTKIIKISPKNERSCELKFNFGVFTYDRDIQNNMVKVKK